MGAYQGGEDYGDDGINGCYRGQDERRKMILDLKSMIELLHLHHYRQNLKGPEIPGFMK